MDDEIREAIERVKGQRKYDVSGWITVWLSDLELFIDLAESCLTLTKEDGVPKLKSYPVGHIQPTCKCNECVTIDMHNTTISLFLPLLAKLKMENAELRKNRRIAVVGNEPFMNTAIRQQEQIKQLQKECEELKKTAMLFSSRIDLEKIICPNCSRKEFDREIRRLQEVCLQTPIHPCGERPTHSWVGRNCSWLARKCRTTSTQNCGSCKGKM